MTKLYPPQDPIALGRHYTRHLEAMTVEGLHGKADIAEQLAARDQEIERLSKALATITEAARRTVDLSDSPISNEALDAMEELEMRLDEVGAEMAIAEDERDARRRTR